MLIKQKKSVDTFSWVRGTIFFISKPQIFTIKVIDGIINKFSFTVNYFSGLKKENTLLKKENLDLHIKLLNLNILTQENQDLKEVLNFTTKNDITHYTIRKINILNNKDFINKATINIEDSSTKENDLVVDSKGNLVGRIINVNGSYAEVLLLTDITSKIPAVLNNSRIKVLLTGNENKNLNIEFFLGEKFNINEGELVFTSSDGNVIQEGIVIGKVVKNKKGKFGVEINTRLDKVSNVIILHNSDNYSISPSRLDNPTRNTTTNDNKDIINTAKGYKKGKAPKNSKDNKMSISSNYSSDMDEGSLFGIVEVDESDENNI